MSLDVVLGAGFLSLAVSRYYAVELPLGVVFCLMIAVWLIYTFDHLSDARKVDRQAATFRHRFHQQHYHVLRFALLPVALLGLGMVFFLPAVIVQWGAIGVGMVASYFLLLKLRFFWFKEIFIATCYTLGVFLGPLSLAQSPLSIFQWLLLPQVLLLALSNLIIFSCFDYHSDRQDGHYSLVMHLGLGRSKKLAFGLLASGLLLNAGMLASANLLLTMEIQLLFMVMNLLLLMLLLREKSFRRHELYRVIGDGVFLIPALILLYAR